MTDRPAPYLPDGRAAEHVRRALGITRPCPANLCALPLVCQHRGTACADEPPPPVHPRLTPDDVPFELRPGDLLTVIRGNVRTEHLVVDVTPDGTLTLEPWHGDTPTDQAPTTP